MTGSSEFEDVERLVEKFVNKELHAAKSGRELFAVLTRVANNSLPGSVVENLNRAIDRILEVVPAYAPPLNVIHRVKAIIEQSVSHQWGEAELQHYLVSENECYANWSVESKDKIAEIVFNFLPQNSKIFTFTLSETVFEVLKRIWLWGTRFSVLVTESRPNNDGLILARQLAELGIPTYVSIDSCMTELIRHADYFISGTEAILEDGSVICKVGTYPASLIAKEFKKPLYILADTMKVNVSSRFGFDLFLDPILPGEVLDDELGSLSQITVMGHLFDKVPSSLIRGIITENGIYSPQGCAVLLDHLPCSMEVITNLSSVRRKNPGIY